jgi:hypothetical protein
VAYQRGCTNSGPSTASAQFVGWRYEECLLKGSQKDDVNTYPNICGDFCYDPKIELFVGICFLGEDVLQFRVQAAVCRSEDAGVVATPVPLAMTVVVRYPKKRSPKKNNLAQFPQVSSLVLDKVENEVKTCFHVKFVYIYIYL